MLSLLRDMIKTSHVSVISPKRHTFSLNQDKTVLLGGRDKDKAQDDDDDNDFPAAFFPLKPRALAIVYT